MNQHRFTAFIIILVLIASLFSACGDSTSQSTAITSDTSAGSSSQVSAVSADPSAEKVNVEFWSFFNGADAKDIIDIVEGFNNSQDEYNIVLTNQEFSEFYTKFKTAVVAGNGPHLTFLHDDYVWGLARDELLVPLDEVADRNGVSIDFGRYTQKVEQMKYDGHYYAVPCDGNARVIMYNKSILKDAGLLGDDGLKNIAPGMDAWVAAMEAIKSNTDKAPLVTSAKGSTPMFMYNSLYYQFGGKEPFVSDDGQSFTMNKEVAVKAMDAYKTIMSYNLEGVQSISEMFLTGGAAFIIDGCYNSLPYAETLGDDFGVMSLHQWGDEFYTAFHCHAFGMPISKNRTPEQEKGALTFLKYFGDNNLEWAKVGYFPGVKDVYESDEFAELPYHKYYFDSSEHMSPYYHYGSPFAIKGSSEITEPLMMAGAGEISPEDAYEEMKARMEAALK